jgi:hypothetical protein
MAERKRAMVVIDMERKKKGYRKTHRNRNRDRLCVREFVIKDYDTDRYV